VVNDYELMSRRWRASRENFDLARYRRHESGAISEKRHAQAHVARSAALRLGSWSPLMTAGAQPDMSPSTGLSACAHPIVEHVGRVKQILASRDYITLFRGSEGTGKSFYAARSNAGAGGRWPSGVVLAPQRQQVTDLCADGLAAETLSHRLETKTLPTGAVVLVDESGQIGGKQLGELVALAKAHSGD